LLNKIGNVPGFFGYVDLEAEAIQLLDNPTADVASCFRFVPFAYIAWSDTGVMERAIGIEPTSEGWEASNF
jgi:hypothetical protein